ncbi:hypothetical protein F5Y16DRAFT_189211 [Xylariaceae sp. FL0255]|nr:hypothetical protein F5Y16DRAFT_189211 [Xylariaceae sp. FL0255]
MHLYTSTSSQPLHSILLLILLSATSLVQGKPCAKSRSLPQDTRSVKSSPSATSVSTEEPSTQVCQIYNLSTTPDNPPLCWAWFFSTTDPSSDYCVNSTIVSTVASTTGDTYATSSSSDPEEQSTWLSSCSTLLSSIQSNPGDYFLANYSTSAFNTFLSASSSSTSCALQLQPEIEASSDQIYMSSADFAAGILQPVITALASSSDADSNNAGSSTSAGVDGVMTCGGELVRWRVGPA